MTISASSIMTNQAKPLTPAQKLRQLNNEIIASLKKKSSDDDNRPKVVDGEGNDVTDGPAAATGPPTGSIFGTA
jgi:hypothetical protein